MKKGDIFYLPAKVLGIKSVCKGQAYKVFIKNLYGSSVMLQVKHYRTKECNKVTLLLKDETVRDNLIPL